MPTLVRLRLQPISNSKSLSQQLTSSPFPLQLGFTSPTKPKSIFISCKASFNGRNFPTRSSNGDHPDDDDDADDDYIQAFLMVTGEFAIEKLIDSLRGNDDGDYPDQFQFLKNVVDRLGYEVKMVRITKRILNTYHARIYVSKPGEKAILTVDARPSDAINVAKNCRVPIYVNKQIVLNDAIVYGALRGKTLKSVYDVTLDSAVEGTDLLAEELHLVRSLRVAISEERYKDAVVLRDKLTKLRTLTFEL